MQAVHLESLGEFARVVSTRDVVVELQRDLYDLIR